MQKSQASTLAKSPEIGWSLATLPWWALILVGVGALLLYLIFSDTNYRETFLFLKDGIIVTLRITLTAFPISTLIGLLVGLARTTKNPFFFTLATLYVEIVRGIPIVVVILIIAFGLVPIYVDVVKGIGAWGLTWARTGFLEEIFTGLSIYSIRAISMELRGIIALSICYGAFEAEVFRAGIQSIGKGQMEAARSLGMGYLLAMRLVILPQAIRRILPPLGNDFIALLKDSSLVTVLAVNELTQLTRVRRSSTFRVMEAFNVVAFLYLTMTLLLSAAVRMLERKLHFVE